MTTKACRPASTAEIAALAGAALPADAPAAADPQRITLLIHGGAGTITRQTITPRIERQYRDGLETALRAGHAVLAGGGSALDAVVAAVVALEDDPLFNAGKGAVFTADGRNELDASVMDGRSGMAGAVAGVTTVRNPVIAARAVMEKTAHVMLIGAGAERFAADQQLAIVEPSYFFTQHRWDQLQKAKAGGQVVLDHDGKPRADGAPSAAASGRSAPAHVDDKFGTVGAVALDQHGNLAAATSTGGVTNKLYGRVGDSPLIGAGTYADNATAAVSCTGSGEFFIRGLVAHDVAARMRYCGISVGEAARQTVADALDARNGQGGLIALSADGEISFAFNTEGMYRGVIRADGKAQTHIYSD
ncbi:isoaspartyl peptidase/L-asparaginase family protein [Piscinibacter sakaiensis]|uniref:isoaspartyl peptidase/L-asparaginase family protein n=1 Tax=Piscinibacter sakaiensis TaxID=1547922 RepID=UPI003AACF641